MADGFGSAVVVYMEDVVTVATVAVVQRPLVVC